MLENKLPAHYQFEKQKHEEFIQAVETFGKTVKEQGPLDERTAHLIQLADAEPMARPAPGAAGPR